MYRTAFVTVAGMLLFVTLGGCPQAWQDDSALWLVDVSGGQAVLEYSKHFDGFVTLPSSIWLGDLTSGKTSRFKAARVQYDFQASGDYYAAELSLDDGKRSRIVAGQFSTADEFTVVERDEELGYTPFVVDRDRVVVSTATGLLVYGLPERAARKTVASPEPFPELISVGGQHALVANAVVDLVADTWISLPPAPDGLFPGFSNCVFTNSRLVTGAFNGDDETGTLTDRRILELDIPAQTWRTVRDYGPPDDGHPLSSAFQTVVGADSQHVVVLHMVPITGKSFVEVLDQTTGEPKATVNVPAWVVEGGMPLLREGRVYWLDSTLSAIMSYDIASGVALVHHFDAPGE